MDAIKSESPYGRHLPSVLSSSEFFDATSVGFIFFDGESTILDCNEEIADWLDVSREDLVGKGCLDLAWTTVREDGTPLAVNDRPHMETLRTNLPQSDVIMGVDIADSSRRWLSVSTYPADVDGDGKGVLSSYIDVTEKRHRIQMMKLLSEVNRFVMFASDESDALRHLCSALVEHGRFALAWIGVTSSDEVGGVDIAFAEGATDYLFDGIVSWSGSKERGLGPGGTALRTGVTHVAHDLAHDPLFEPWRERAAACGFRSLVAIPFAPGGRRAVLCVYERHTMAFDETAVSYLEDIAREVEFGIAHVRSVHQLETALDGTLAALAMITEARDPYTAGHQFRVGLLGAAIATHLGLDQDLIELIRQSGEVHDVGKTAIPSEILTRPRKLSPIEYEMVKHHTTIGDDILRRASLPWPIAEVAAQHHERMDGSGYPRGLTGADIIQPARIIAVADVVEAMINHRPYRPGLGLDMALGEIRSGAGVLYDADVVNSCLAVFEAGFKFAKSDIFDLSVIE